MASFIPLSPSMAWSGPGFSGSVPVCRGEKHQVQPALDKVVVRMSNSVWNFLYMQPSAATLMSLKRDWKCARLSKWFITVTQQTQRWGGHSQEQAMMAGQSRLLPMFTFTTHRNSFGPDTPTSASYKADCRIASHRLFLGRKSCPWTHRKDYSGRPTAWEE